MRTVQPSAFQIEPVAKKVESATTNDAAVIPTRNCGKFIAFQGRPGASNSRGDHPCPFTPDQRFHPFGGCASGKWMGSVRMVDAEASGAPKLPISPLEGEMPSGGKEG
ncbi:hypothetical protein, partial [Mesorhizobium sp.]|uniref:hypothetical protein n=1 Tax=Mesorhizobium sp. TaxID=1871066 RepID=UPI00257D0A95